MIMRIDLYMVEKQWVKTRSQARDLIKRGLVFHSKKQVTKAGYDLRADDIIEVIEKPVYVSRAGLKLEDALNYFKLDLGGLDVLDIGASTGGFTDCALKHGANHVYAYDVGHNQLDQSIKEDSRVTSYEKTNILSVDIPEVDVILVDVSFTSIKPILEHIKHHQKEVLALVKPQFEVGKITMKQGVLKDQTLIDQILNDVEDHIKFIGFHIKGMKPSALKGKAGNQEFMFYLKKNLQNSVV